MAGIYLPNHIIELIDLQVAKFTFKSSRLRNIIDFQIENSKGDITALNACRHYVNSKGECPYDVLYEPIREAIDTFRFKRKKILHPNVFYRLEQKAHDRYKNMINNKLYAYTLKRVCLKLNNKA